MGRRWSATVTGRAPRSQVTRCESPTRPTARESRKAGLSHLSTQARILYQPPFPSLVTALPMLRLLGHVANSDPYRTLKRLRQSVRCTQGRLTQASQRQPAQSIECWLGQSPQTLAPAGSPLVGPEELGVDALHELASTIGLVEGMSWGLGWCLFDSSPAFRGKVTGRRPLLGD